MLAYKSVFILEEGLFHLLNISERCLHLMGNIAHPLWRCSVNDKMGNLYIFGI